MAVVEFDPITNEEFSFMMGEKDFGPSAHIYHDDDYPVALCGHVSPYDIEDNPELPWYKGLHDCKECWSIQHTLDDIDSL